MQKKNNSKKKKLKKKQKKNKKKERDKIGSLFRILIYKHNFCLIIVMYWQQQRTHMLGKSIYVLNM